jgi:hypothetical protein
MAKTLSQGPHILVYSDDLVITPNTAVELPQLIDAAITVQTEMKAHEKCSLRKGCKKGNQHWKLGPGHFMSLSRISHPHKGIPGITIYMIKTVRNYDYCQHYHKSFTISPFNTVYMTSH